MLVGKRKHYEAQDPKNLFLLLDKKKLDLAGILNELSTTISATGSKLQINFFPGVNGISLAGDIFLEESKTKLWKTFEQPVYTAKLEGLRETDEYVRKRVKKGIRARMIIPAGLKSEWIEEHLAHDKEELRETIVVSPDVYPLEASIGVTRGMVLLIAARSGNSASSFAVLVKNDELAETISSIHDMVWDRYKS